MKEKNIRSEIKIMLNAIRWIAKAATSTT